MECDLKNKDTLHATFDHWFECFETFVRMNQSTQNRVAWSTIPYLSDVDRVQLYVYILVMRLRSYFCRNMEPWNIESWILFIRCFATPSITGTRKCCSSKSSSSRWSRMRETISTQHNNICASAPPFIISTACSIVSWYRATINIPVRRSSVFENRMVRSANHAFGDVVVVIGRLQKKDQPQFPRNIRHTSSNRQIGLNLAMAEDNSSNWNS